jgi:hypothetical protein
MPIIIPFGKHRPSKPEQDRIRTVALERAYRELTSAGIACELLPTCVKGSYYSEPFFVSMQFMERPNHPGNFLGVLVTRYKGKGYNKPPVEALKGAK